VERRAQAAVYRPADGQPWQDVEITGHHTDGRLILREIGKLWPGVFVASLDQVRVQGRVFEFRKPFRNDLRRGAA
jgi:hypothetical protein